MFGNAGLFSHNSRGFLEDDLPQQRRAFQQADPYDSPLQRNSFSRPSGRAIYNQRKEYSEVLNREPDRFQVRVEHLFTCELDGQEVSTVNDCVAKLMSLDAKGRLWPQEMIMEIKGMYLQLCDIETQTELDSIPLSSIMQTKAVLDSGTYNSLLTVTVQERSKRFPQVFMFQCEETGAELIKTDLDKAVKRGGGDFDPRREPPYISRNDSGKFREVGPHPVKQEGPLPPPDYAAQHRINREPDYMPLHRSITPQEEIQYSDLNVEEMRSSPNLGRDRFNKDRATEILNHVIDDLEIFMGKMAAAANGPSQPENQKKKKKKSKTKSPALNLPPWDEYVSCLQKIKYGFNLLAQLSDNLNNPSAPDFVHIFFTNLGIMVPRYPADLPPTVVAPLLTPEAINLLSQTLNPQEKHLWLSLGDCWAVSSWPNEVTPYIPVFYDGWQPPPPAHAPPELHHQNGPISRSNSQRPPGGRPDKRQSYSDSRATQRWPEEPAANGPWSSAPPARPTEPPLYMRVMYNFTAKNNQELTVMKGEEVQVVQKFRLWWLVRNSHGEEGSVPPNILEQVEEEQPRNTRGPVTLNMSSSPAEVKAWLEYKGFSRITVSSLGVLSGNLLLGMSKDEIRTVCPEEAGKVFFQLQAVKSSLALASEPPGMYNRY